MPPHSFKQKGQLFRVGLFAFCGTFRYPLSLARQGRVLWDFLPFVDLSGKLRVVVPPGYSLSTFIDDIVELCRKFPEIDQEFEFDCMLRDQIRFADASGRPCAAMPRSRISVNSLASLIELTVAGLGLACLPVPAARESVAAGRLVPVLAGVKVDAVVCSVFFPSRPGDSSLSRLFVDFIVERRAGRAEPYLYR